MSKMASAPQVGGSVARQRGCVPPPHSSVKITLVPSLLNEAECQYAKLGSTTSSTRTGWTGSLMSNRMPFPEQAPAASPTAGYAVMSWHARVVVEGCGVGDIEDPDAAEAFRVRRQLSAPPSGSLSRSARWRLIDGARRRGGRRCGSRCRSRGRRRHTTVDASTCLFHRHEQQMA